MQWVGGLGGTVLKSWKLPFLLLDMQSYCDRGELWGQEHAPVAFACICMEGPASPASGQTPACACASWIIRGSGGPNGCGKGI